MPAPLNVNREAVKTLAIAIGVRQAAREMGLPEDTVRQWSCREKWFSNPAETAPIINGRRSVSPYVTKPPGAALADRLARLGEESKLLLSQAGVKASRHLARLPGKAVTRQSADLKNVVSANAQLHGWDQRFQGTQFSLNVLNVGECDITIGES